MLRKTGTTDDLSFTPVTDNSANALEHIVLDVKHRMDHAWSVIIDESLKNSHPRLCAAMDYAMGSGQRLRPTLMALSARSLGLRMPMSAMLALECIHCYSLIHDDLPAMDNDSMRRGQESTHVKFDEATAILTGDALLTLAFQLITSCEGPIATHSALVRALAVHTGPFSLVDGQFHDMYPLRNHDNSDKQIARDGINQHDDWVRTARKKTASLFTFAAVAPAILCNMPEDHPRRMALALFGDRFGLAYQCLDDCRDGDAKHRPDISLVTKLIKESQMIIQPWIDQCQGLVAFNHWLLEKAANPA